MTHEKFNVEELRSFLDGSQLQDYLGPECFVDKKQYYAQIARTAIGRIRYLEPAGIGMLEHWISFDGTLLITVNPSDGTVDWVDENIKH